MVQLYRTYRCDICNEMFDSEMAALKCEKRGQPKLIFPRGLIFKCPEFTSNWEEVLYVVKADSVICHHHSLECFEYYDVNSINSVNLINLVNSIDIVTKTFEFEKVSIIKCDIILEQCKSLNTLLIEKELDGKDLRLEIDNWWNNVKTSERIG